MDIDPRTYPSRTFVRFTAHNQLQADATGKPITAAIKRTGCNTYVQKAIPGGEFPPPISDSDSGDGFGLGFSMDSTCSDGTETGGCAVAAATHEFDDALFEEIVKTTFSAKRYPELYQSCGTQAAAAKVETRVATEIVSAYRRINQKQQDCLIVQRLNSLL